MEDLDKILQERVESTQSFVVKKIKELAKELKNREGLNGYDCETLESIYAGYVRMRKLIKIQADLVDI